MERLGNNDFTQQLGKDTNLAPFAKLEDATTVLLNNLEPDRWVRKAKIINLLTICTSNPEFLLQEMLSDGRLERDHIGDFCLPAVCWLKHTLILESGKEITNEIGKNGYPADWGEDQQPVSFLAPPKKSRFYQALRKGVRR
jgi:hypothetical protein